MGKAGRGFALWGGCGGNTPSFWLGQRLLFTLHTLCIRAGTFAKVAAR